MKNGDKLENNDAIKTENKDSNKESKEYEAIVNDDKTNLFGNRTQLKIYGLIKYVNKRKKKKLCTQLS